MKMTANSGGRFLPSSASPDACDVVGFFAAVADVVGVLPRAGVGLAPAGSLGLVLGAFAVAGLTTVVAGLTPCVAGLTPVVAGLTPVVACLTTGVVDMLKR